jgi:hypothetical protein
MAAKDKVIKQLTALYVCRDATGTFGSTTLTAVAAKAASALTVAAITNFAAGDVIRIGSGEEMEIGVITGTPSGSTINLTEPLQFSHASGEVVVEMVAYDVGDVAESGVDFNVSGDSVDIPLSTSRFPLASITGFVEASIGATLPTVQLEGIAHAIGALLTQVAGAGTALSPSQLTVNGTEFGGQSNIGIVALGVTMDGSVLRIELWGCDADYTGINFTLSRGQVVGVPMRFVGARGAISSTTFPGTPNTTLRNSKAKVWNALTEVGYFLDTVTTTTVAVGAVAADAVLINFTSATSFAPDEWVRIGSGNRAQFFQIASKASNAVTMKQKAKYGIDIGATITKVTPTSLGAPSEAGVSVAFGGTVTPLRSSTYATAIGLRQGVAEVTVSFGLIEHSLANFERALGIPAGTAASNRLPLNLIGTGSIEGLYLKGLLAGGETAWVIAAGCSIDASNVATAITNSGAAAALPITAKPSSYVQFLQLP